MKLRQNHAHFRLGATIFGMTALLTSGCANAPTENGDPATWELLNNATVSSTSTQIEIAVTRVDCSSGVTGEVWDPEISYRIDQIVITALVAPQPDGDYSCPSNDAVPLLVKLEEPIGNRELVDGICLTEANLNYSYCETEIRSP